MTIMAPAYRLSTARMRTVEYDKNFTALHERAESILRDYRVMAGDVAPGDELRVMDIIVHDDLLALLRAAHKYHNGVYSRRNTTFNALRRELEDTVSMGEQMDNVERIHAAAQEGILHGERADYLKKCADEILNILASLAHRAEINGVFDDCISRWESDHIVDSSGVELMVGGVFETGSREWLEFRQNGMGASDVAGVNSSGRWRFKEIRRIWDSKTTPISESEVHQNTTAQDVFDDPRSRGNAFEEYIGYLYSVRFPEVNVMVNKSTWISEDNCLQVNYDLLTDATGDGIPDGVLEIKTASTAREWGEDGSGFEGIPEGYGIQLLTQMRHAGFDHGAMAVLIDGTELRSYQVEMTDELRELADHYIKVAEGFYADAVAFNRGEDIDFPEEVKWNPWRSFDKRVTESTELDGAKMKIIREVAAVSGMSVDDVRDRYLSRISDDPDAKEIEEVLSSLYRDVTPVDMSSWVGIDLETTGFSPLKSRIIEVGVTGENMIDELYGVSDFHREIHGTGAVDVHNITVNDISGKQEFDGAARQKVVDALVVGGVMVAHYAEFEMKHLLSESPEFAVAYNEGKITVVDSMNITRHMIGCDSARLQDLVESQGGEYTGAHRAYRDAEMMMDALSLWSRG